MFKRSKKLTAILVAAASIVSVVPVSAQASERLDTKGGTIEKAFSFKDGRYLYKGYETEEDDNAIYYSDGENEAHLEYVQDSDIESKYGEKYAYVKDSDDEYFINLDNGKIEDDEELEDKIQNIRLKLKTALKRTDRYGKDITVTLELDNMLHNNNFSDIWYSYSASITSEADGYDEAFRNELYGFTDGEAKYIDVCHTANMYVYSSKKNKMVKVEKFNDEDSDTAIKVVLNYSPKYIAQDEDYIYAITVVKIIDSNIGVEYNKYYLQKISKAQGEKQDDAYIPKSVESYEISDEYDNEDADDLYNMTNDKDYNKIQKVAVKNGTMYIIQVNIDNDKMKVTKLKMKKEKVNSDNGSIDGKLDVQLLEKDDDEEQDIANGEQSISIDVEGNIWALDKGTIVKFNDLSPEEIYKCDNSLDNLDVYDSNNLIAWDGSDEGDAYAIVKSGNTSDEDEFNNNNQPVLVKSGWEKNSDGTWSYYKDNAMVKGQWVQDGNWYYLKADGIMATGWQFIYGSWYYMNQLGAMMTGWLQDTDGKWYYLNPESGAMLSSTTVDGYVLGADGAWIK